MADEPSGYVLADNLNPVAKVPDQFAFDPREWEEFLEGCCDNCHGLEGRVGGFCDECQPPEE